MTVGELRALVRTAALLQPGQVTQRARLRAQRSLLRHSRLAGRWLLAGTDPASAVGWPARFRPIDGRVWRRRPELGGLRSGRITLLGISKVLGLPPRHQYGDDGYWQADWAQVSAPRLWRFHLHYWDWAWTLTGEPGRSAAQDLFAVLWRSWQESVTVGRGDAWLPYPSALRAWSFCGLYRPLVADSKIEGPFLASLATHVGFLRRNLEVDVGGNHLIKDLKALAGLAVFFADERLLDWALDRLVRQLAVQVLDDGGHYERAPAYHCQVLADLIDISGLLRATERQPGPELLTAIQRMRYWLGCVLSPDGQVPLLNDGYPVSAGLLAALRAEPSGTEPLQVMPDSGLVRAAVGGWHLLADVGAPCPDELPAHAHADTLSCLLHVDGVPLLVDTGTSTYALGPTRGHERSTAAHNTVEVDGANSTEVWGAFRAGRRARVSNVFTQADQGVLSVEAAHDGYRKLPGHPWHRRRWSLSEAGLQVEDMVLGSGSHTSVVRWHFAPGSVLRLVSGGAVVTWPGGGRFRVSVTANAPITLAAESGLIAIGFQRTVEAPVLTCTIYSTLPQLISTGWRKVTDRQLAAGSRSAIGITTTSSTNAAPGTNTAVSAKAAASANASLRPGEPCETDRPASLGRASRCTGRAAAGAGCDRGPGAYGRVGDLSRHRARTHRTRSSGPAREGAGSAGPGPAGDPQGAVRWAGRHQAGSAGPTRQRPTAGLLCGWHCDRGGPGRHRGVARPARGHGRRGQG